MADAVAERICRRLDGGEIELERTGVILEELLKLEPDFFCVAFDSPFDKSVTVISSTTF